MLITLANHALQRSGRRFDPGRKLILCEAERVQSPPASWGKGKGRKVWHPQAVRSKLIIATLWSDVAQGKSGGLIAFFLFSLSSGAAWEGRMRRDFERGRRGSKVVKCVWLRPKSLGFAGSTPALFCKRSGDRASVPSRGGSSLGPGSVVG